MNPRIRLCIINRNFPPENGATGRYAQQLISFLRSTDLFEITTISISNRPQSGAQLYVKEIYSGKIKWKRLFASYVEGFLLIRKAYRLNPDIFIVLTDPAFLSYWASGMLKNKKWILWTMDLYPEAFSANGLISDTNPIYKHYERRLRQGPPNYFWALGRQQAKYLRKKYYSDIPVNVIPVGLNNNVISGNKSRKSTPTWAVKDKIIIGYVGSIGEAHDAKEIISFIKKLDDKRYKFILSCYGAKAQKVIKEVKDLKNVHITDYLEPEELPFIDIQIVSLLKKWTHVCVPSKALSAIENNSAILFFGEEYSDTWEYVKEAGWRISSAEDVENILDNLNRNSLEIKKNKAIGIYENLFNQKKASFLEIKDILMKLYNNEK